MALGGIPPDRGELLEVRDLLQAGQQLLLGGRRSTDWTRTHHATDAAEEAADVLQRAMSHGGLRNDPEGTLATLQNLLAAAADGVFVLVGTYPHTGDAEDVAHPADVIALAEGGNDKSCDDGGTTSCLPRLQSQKETTTTPALPGGGPAARGPSSPTTPHPVDDRALGGRR